MSFELSEPSVELICLSDDSCPRFGDRTLVRLRMVAPGVLEIPSYFCADCLTEMARVTDKEEHSVGS